MGFLVNLATMDELTTDFYEDVQSVFGAGWLSTAVTVCVVLLGTAIVAHLLTKLLRRVLTADHNPLPATSIFVNIGRVAVWVLGLSVVLSSCFGIDVTAAVTALGIGGLAISLGFQDTLSNLISGLQLSLIGLVHPGDRIQVGSQTGVVCDMTWRHTRIKTLTGEFVYIPNSALNTNTLVKLDPVTTLRVPVVVTLAPGGAGLERVTELMEQRAGAAAATMCTVEKAPKIHYSEITDYGFKGTLIFAVSGTEDIAEVRTRALKAVASLAHGDGGKEEDSYGN